MDSKRNIEYAERIEDFRRVLSRADFSYNYADDPRAYREGEKSVDEARSAMNMLICDFPKKKNEIESLFSSYAGRSGS